MDDTPENHRREMTSRLFRILYTRARKGRILDYEIDVDGAEMGGAAYAENGARFYLCKAGRPGPCREACLGNLL